MSEENAKILSDEEADQLFKDGMENLIAGLGSAIDKRSHSRFVNSRRLSATGNQAELDSMYETDWLAGKVVDILPDDMTREWREFTGEMEPDVVQSLHDEEDRLDLRGAFNQAHKWARLYGTAFIVINVDDGQTPDKPLDVSRIKKGQLKHIKAVDRHLMHHADQVPILDPTKKSFGFPEYYRIAETSVKIHHSRVLRFDGVRLPTRRFRENNYYSNSVLDRLYEALTNFVTTADGAASMVYETNVDVMKIKGLMNMLSSAEGEALIRRRFALASAMKSFNNMLLLDAEEEVVFKKNSFAGLPDLMDRFALFLSAASDIPATRLLGSSASGLNATGEGDLKNYYDTVRSMQQKEYKPLLDYFDEIMARNLDLPDDIDLAYQFNSLFQMTPKETSDLQYQDAQRDELYYNMGVLTEAQIARELVQKGTYTNIDEDHIKALEEVENELAPDTDDPEDGDEPEAEGEEAEENEGDEGGEES